MSFSRDLLSGNRLLEDVIDYQWPKWFITTIRNLNSNFTLCNRLHMHGNRLPAIIERFDSNFKAYNRLYKSCNRLLKEIFRKLFPRVTTFQMVFTWPLKVYLYVTWNTNLLRVFQNKKVLSSQKQNYLILLKIPWPIHLQFNKELFECLVVQSISFKRDFFFSSSYC